MRLIVHWVRHGEVASHRGDVPLTEAGLAGALSAGRRLGELVEPGEQIWFLHATTRRTRQTVEAIRSGVSEVVARRSLAGVTLYPPELEPALRNPDMYLAGRRVEFVSSTDALAEQVPDTGIGPSTLLRLPFWPDFWASPDRIGYWVAHPDPPGEDAAAVARRLLAYAMSLRWLPAEGPRRYVCVTHSPALRAFLQRYLLAYDPGEPNFCESIDIDFAPGNSGRVLYRQQSASLPG